MERRSSREVVRMRSRIGECKILGGEKGVYERVRKR